jgi:hypothetical protein
VVVAVQPGVGVAAGRLLAPAHAPRQSGFDEPESDCRLE